MIYDAYAKRQAPVKACRFQIRFAGCGCCAHCTEQLSAVENHLRRLAEHVGGDHLLDRLALLDEPHVRHGWPTSWAEMEALGLDPETGEAA